jgi:hypothetical protein
MKISVWSMMCCALTFSLFSSIGEAGSSGVPTAKKLNEVADQEAKQMCDVYRKDAKEIRKGNCTLDALVNAKDKKECNAIRDACLELIDDESTDAKECTEIDVVDFAGCAVTVGDIETCISELTAYVQSLSCNQFGSELPGPPNCMEALNATCSGNP